MNIFNFTRLRLRLPLAIAALSLSLAQGSAQEARPLKFTTLTVGSYRFVLPGKMKPGKVESTEDIASRIWSSDTSNSLPGDVMVIFSSKTFTPKLWEDVKAWKPMDFKALQDSIKLRQGIKEVGGPFWHSEEERSKILAMVKSIGDPDRLFGKDNWMPYEVIVNTDEKRQYTSGSVPYGGGSISLTTTTGGAPYRAADVYVVSHRDRTLYTLRIVGGSKENFPPYLLVRALAEAKLR